MYQLYGDNRSGHCYKVQLVCSLLDIDYQWIEIDLVKQEHLTADFLAISPQHKIPVLVTDDSEILLESNAIIHYLAKKHDKENRLIPTDDMAYAQMLQWQFYEQSQFQPPISLIRRVKLYQFPENHSEEYQQKLSLTQTNLQRLNSYLENKQFLIAESLSLADISLFAYAHIAHHGGIELHEYPNVQKWINTIKNQNKFIEMNI